MKGVALPRAETIWAGTPSRGLLFAEATKARALLENLAQARRRPAGPNPGTCGKKRRVLNISWPPRRPSGKRPSGGEEAVKEGKEQKGEA